MYEGLLSTLREYAEWADENIYDVPIMLPDTLKKAADAIENTSKAYQMMAEAYEAEVTKSCWIPVTERLPKCERGTEVGNIEWISCGKVYAGCFGRGGRYRDAYFRTWTDGTEGIDAKDADYWRPIQIPEPPKEET